VVPIKNQEWKYPPFEAKIAEGYLWGRGTLDMKGGVAMMVSALLKARVKNIASIVFKKANSWTKELPFKRKLIKM